MCGSNLDDDLIQALQSLSLSQQRRLAHAITRVTTSHFSQFIRAGAKASPKHPFVMRLEPGLRLDLDDCARRERITTAQLLRRAVKAYLPRRDDT